MAQFLGGIVPDKEKRLSRIMSSLGIRNRDISERFIRASAPGGQNVNKTSTCVYLKHIPTGIEVKCQQERSQAQNRYLARLILAKKIEERIKESLAQELQRLHKLRRQRRRRSQKAKLKILEQKRRHSQKKLLRKRVWSD